MEIARQKKEEKIPEQIGDYKLIGRIKKGLCGDVFECYSIKD